MIAQAAPALSEEEREKNRPSTANFWFSKNGAGPANFDGATIEKEVTITMKGKIQAINAPSEYDGGRRMELNISSIEISAPVEKTTMSDAIEKNTTRIG